jgi:hypothetical protein
VGTVQYDRDNHVISWEIGRLPTSVYKADAEFSISVTPSESDRDRILVLSPGSKVEAKDTDTEAILNISTKAKTSRLEDDEIADMNSDGRVR